METFGVLATFSNSLKLFDKCELICVVLDSFVSLICDFYNFSILVDIKGTDYSVEPIFPYSNCEMSGYIGPKQLHNHRPYFQSHILNTNP